MAEDNPVNQKVARLLFRRLGFEVVMADNGARAVEAARAGTYPMIFMDCEMPQMNGFEATAAIRKAEGAGRHVPIVAMTAHALAGDRERCLEAGMDDYISKPIQIRELEAALDRWTCAPDGVELDAA